MSRLQAIYKPNIVIYKRISVKFRIKKSFYAYSTAKTQILLLCLK